MCCPSLFVFDLMAYFRPAVLDLTFELEFQSLAVVMLSTCCHLSHDVDEFYLIAVADKAARLLNHLTNQRNYDTSDRAV